MAIRSVTRAGVGLVVGIIILAALVFGGIWFLRERGEQAQRQEAINIAEEQLEAESGEEVAIGSEEDTKDETDKESEAIPQGGAAPAQPAQPTKTSNSSQLPQTGPEASSIIGLGLLTFLVASFIRSRKVISSEL